MRYADAIAYPSRKILAATIGRNLLPPDSEKSARPGNNLVPLRIYTLVAESINDARAVPRAAFFRWIFDILVVTKLALSGPATLMHHVHNMHNAWRVNYSASRYAVGTCDNAPSAEKIPGYACMGHSGFWWGVWLVDGQSRDDSWLIRLGGEQRRENVCARPVQRLWWRY